MGWCTRAAETEESHKGVKVGHEWKSWERVKEDEVITQSDSDLLSKLIACLIISSANDTVTLNIILIHQFLTFTS